MPGLLRGQGLGRAARDAAPRRRVRGRGDRAAQLPRSALDPRPGPSPTRPGPRSSPPRGRRRPARRRPPRRRQGGRRQAVLDPALLIDARDRRRLLRADRRAARAIRPVIAPEDVVRFGSARAASRFVIAGPLPPRARRLALELGLAPPEAEPLPSHRRGRASSSRRALAPRRFSATPTAGPSRPRAWARSPPATSSSRASSMPGPWRPSSRFAVPAGSRPAAFTAAGPAPRPVRRRRTRDRRGDRGPDTSASLHRGPRRAGRGDPPPGDSRPPSTGRSNGSIDSVRLK